MSCYSNIFKINAFFGPNGWTGDVLMRRGDGCSPYAVIHISFKNTWCSETEEWSFEYFGGAVDKEVIHGEIFNCADPSSKVIASYVLGALSYKNSDAPSFDRCTVALRSVYNETMVEETIVSCKKKNIDWMFKRNTNPRVALTGKYGKVISHTIREKNAREKFFLDQMELLEIKGK
jgi:hypothetical protein